MKKLLGVVCFIAVVNACTINYYGYTKEEWDNLKAEQQKEAKNQYQKNERSRTQ